MVDTSLTAAGSQSAGLVSVTATYLVVARIAPDEQAWPSQSDPVASRIRAVLVATFVTAEGGEIDDVALKAFAISTGALAIHPFSREVVESTSARLAYPPFTMELIRSVWSPPVEQVIELDLVQGAQARPRRLPRAAVASGRPAPTIAGEHVPALTSCLGRWVLEWMSSAKGRSALVSRRESARGGLLVTRR